MADGLLGAGAAGAIRLSPHLLAALAPLLVLLVALDASCRVDPS